MERVLPHRPLFIRFCLVVVVVLGLLLHPATVWCVSSNDDAKTTEVEGVGPNRDLALKDAWRNAVESTVGGFVASATLVKNHQLIEDYILAYADGYIEDFDVLGERYRSGNYWIKIRATVKKGLLLNTLKRHNINIKGESLYATLMTNKQAKKNRVEICKLELEQWYYPRDFATVSCDSIEVLPDTDMEWFRFSSSQGGSEKLLNAYGTQLERYKYYQVEVAYLKASGCKVEVNGERIGVHYKWLKEAKETDNDEMSKFIYDNFHYWRGEWAPRGWYSEVGLQFYNSDGEFLLEYEARAIEPPFLPYSTARKLKRPRVSEKRRFHRIPKKGIVMHFSYIEDCYTQDAYYPVPLEILKSATKIQPVVVRMSARVYKGGR